MSMPRRRIDWTEVHRRLERLADAVERGWRPTEDEDRRILLARARALAAPFERAADGRTVEAIAFRLGEEHYAIESAFVAEVFPLIELTRLPGTPDFVLGIVNVRGEIVSVVDLGKFFDLPPRGLTELNRVLLLQDDAMAFGILADSVDGVRAFTVERLQPALPTLADRRRDYLKGIADGRVVVLDAPRLLADPRMIVEESVGDQEARPPKTQ